MQKYESEITIVGGGPVGLAAACALADCGLKVLLVDAGKRTGKDNELEVNVEKPKFDPRVSALTVSTRNLLKRFGAWDEIERTRLCPYEHMTVWDGDGTGAINFSADELHEPALGYIVENRVLSAALAQQVVARSAITVLEDCAVERVIKGDHDLVSLSLSNGASVDTALLIGADGAHSFIRKESGFSTREWEYGQEAVITTVKTEYPHEFTAWQRFMNSGPLAFLPLFLPGLDDENQCYCSIVWSCVTEKAEGIKALDDKEFKKALGSAFEFRLGEIQEVDKRFSFSLWQRHATDYVQDGTALIGDAAHTIHPLAGQGVNLGFGDVEALSGVISAAVNKGEDYRSREVLSRYQRYRKSQNLGMMAAMESFKRLFGSEELTVMWLRNTGLNLMNSLPLVKEQLMRKAMGI